MKFVPGPLQAGTCDAKTRFRDGNRTENALKPEELRKLDIYFKRTFNSQMQVRARPSKDDSAEVYIGDEFLGVLFRDDEDGDLSFNFSMAILDIDLDDFA